MIKKAISHHYYVSFILYMLVLLENIIFLSLYF